MLVAATLSILMVVAIGSAGRPRVSVSIVSPANGQTLSGAVTWEARSTGSVAPTYVDFLIDGSLRWREWWAPYVFNGDGAKLDTRNLADGAHTLRVVAYDARGNSASQSVTVTVANAPLPSVSIQSPTTGSTLSGVSTWLAGVSGGTVAKVDFLVDGVVKWSEKSSPYGYGGAAGQFDTRGLADGSHTLRNVAYTTDGRSVSASVTVKVANTQVTSATPPSLSTAPSISGTATVGSTLTVSAGSWAGTAPLSYAYQWQRCSSASSCSSVSGATSAAYALSSADAGAMMRATVTASNSGGSASATTSPTSVVASAPSTSTPPPPPPPSASTSTRSFTGWGDSLREPFSPTRTVTVTSPSEFASAWAAIQPGDLIDVRGVTFSGQLSLINKQLSDWAEIHFDSATRLVGGGDHGLNALWLKNVSKLRIYGGDVTNPTGNGFRIEDSSDVTWWGFKVHDAAGDGGLAFGITKAQDRLDLRGEISNVGSDLSLDPHAEKGTGLHGLYLSGGDYRTSGTFILKVHDVPVGAAIEAGPHLQNAVIEVDARRMTKVATQQVGGNALQFWGNDFKNVVVRYVYGEDLAGRVVETDGLYTGSSPAGAVNVQYGRSGGTIRLDPKYAPASDGSVVYGDCS